MTGLDVPFSVGEEQQEIRDILKGAEIVPGVCWVASVLLDRDVLLSGRLHNQENVSQQRWQVAIQLEKNSPQGRSCHHVPQLNLPGNASRQERDGRTLHSRYLDISMCANYDMLRTCLAH